MKKKLQNFSLVILSIMFSLIALEVLIRIALPLKQKRVIYSKTRDIFHRHKENILYEQKLGYVLKSNVGYKLANREFKIDIFINSQGFRDDEESLDNPDILLMGDSFAFGTGVNKNESCEYFLETMLNKTVLNMGVAGYGTLQELILLERWINKKSGNSINTSNTAANGVSNDSDFFPAGHFNSKRKMVIFMLFGGNDLNDNVGYGIRYRPFIKRENGEYTIIQPTKEGFSRWLNLVEARIYPEVCKSLFIPYLFVDAYKQFIQSYNHDRLEEVDYSIRFDVFELIVREIRKLAKDNNVKILFVYIPTIQYFEGKNDDKRYQPIEVILQNNSIDVIDLRDVLKRNDYYKYDGHWRSSGHYKAAVSIKEYISRSYAASDN